MNEDRKPRRRLRKWQAWLAGLVGLATLAAVVYARSTHWLFQFMSPGPGPAQAILRVEPFRPRLYGKDQDGEAGPKENPERYFRTQIELIKSKHVLAQAINDPQIADRPIVQGQPDPIGWLKGALHVEAIQDTYLIRVSMEDHNPEDAFEILKAVIRAYMKQIKLYGQTSSVVLIDLMKEESQKLKTELSAAYGELLAMTERSGLDEASLRRRNEYWQYLRRELVLRKLEMVAAKVQGPRIEAQKGAHASKAEGIASHPSKVLEAQSKLLEEEISKAEGEISRTEVDHTKSLSLRRKIERLESRLASIDDQLREATWQTGIEQIGVSIADPPRLPGK